MVFFPSPERRVSEALNPSRTFNGHSEREIAYPDPSVGLTTAVAEWERKSSRPKGLSSYKTLFPCGLISLPLTGPGSIEQVQIKCAAGAFFRRGQNAPLPSLCNAMLSVTTTRSNRTHAFLPLFSLSHTKGPKKGCYAEHPLFLSWS